MKRSLLLVALFGVLAARVTFAQNICAGASGGSTACAPACSNIIVNDDVVPNSNQGKFDVGEGNQGDGNDGFNNQGNFNIGTGSKANCAPTSAQTTGSCDPSNNNGQIVLRFCHVYPTDSKCQPSGYLPEYTQALEQQIAAVVASCNGGPALPTPPPSPPASPPPPAGTPGSAPVVPTTPGPGTPVTPNVVVPLPTVLPPGAATFIPVSDSTADLVTLLKLFEEHLALDKQMGRKMK